ncbi:unnamed protein product, partial [Laminaria digitata]
RNGDRLPTPVHPVHRPNSTWSAHRLRWPPVVCLRLAPDSTKWLIVCANSSIRLHSDKFPRRCGLGSGLWFRALTLLFLYRLFYPILIPNSVSPKTWVQCQRG